jgi:Na+/H+-dicarboxylate symporter
MMYCTFATVFIAQAYGIEMSLGQQMTMMAVLMLTSKGMAGVPRASLVVIAATLGQFNIPEAGMLLLLGIDHFLDMARSRPTSSATASPPPSSPSGKARWIRRNR